MVRVLDPLRQRYTRPSPSLLANNQIIQFSLLVVLCLQSHAFQYVTYHEKRSASARHVVPLQTNEESSSKSKDNVPVSMAPLLDWNASGSIGSLLMQMQKKEEEMRKFNKTLLDRNQAVDLSLHNSTVTPPIERYDEDDSSGVDIIDAATAKELDDAISIRLSSSPGKDIQILELPPLYQVLQEREIDETTRDDWPSLSKPEHYEDRIGRDMRQLAVSIASCVDNPTEFQMYCQQIRGGIYPLLECIREGANAVRHRGDVLGSRNRQQKSSSSYVTSDPLGASHYEERFLAASSACRALRDLCAISVDFAVVITDSLLRANADKVRPNLMEDLATLLQYSYDAEIHVAPDGNTGPRGRLFRRKSRSSQWTINFSQNRRGKIGN